MTVTVAVRKNRIDDLANGLEDLVGGVLGEARAEIAEKARQYVHVISGETRDSIRVEADSVVADHGAVFEELGTVYRDPHPFMYPAFEEVTAELPGRIGQRIEEFVG